MSERVPITRVKKIGNDAGDFLSVKWIQHTLFHGQIFQEMGLFFNERGRVSNKKIKDRVLSCREGDHLR